MGPAPRSAAVLAAGLSLLLATALAAPSAVEAQRSMVFERLHADIEVQPSGDLIVTETLMPHFTGEWDASSDGFPYATRRPMVRGSAST